MNSISLPMPAREEAPWQEEMRHALRTGRELLDFCGLAPDVMDLDAQPDFPCRIPRPWAARIRPGDPEDPLLLQVLPRLRERERVPGFVTDPTADLAALRGAGLLQKYQGRCLVVATSACAIHCRYCFRRHFPYGEQQDPWQALRKVLQADTGIREVILSGGDPLMLTTRRLEMLGDLLAGFPRVKTLRFHTRMPVVLPQRVDGPLLGWLRRLPQRLVMVLHVNHAQELDDATAHALRQLRQVGVQLLNQAVLLEGVNADTDSLQALCETLFTQGVLPYYLHLLDPVAGAAHFQVEDVRALRLHRQLRARLPGYLVPRLAREQPGEPAKRVLAG